MPPLKAQPQDDASRWAWRLRVALMLLSLLPLGVSVGGYFFVRRATNFQERTLEEFLVALGRKVAASIPADDVLWVLPLVSDPKTGELYTERVEAYADLPAWTSLRKAVAELQEGGTVSGAMLLTTAGDTILRGDGGVVAEKDLHFAREQDPKLVALAASGTVAATPRLPSEETKRVYVPLRIPATANAPEKIVGILRIEAGREYFAGSQRAQERSLVILGITVVVLTAAWYSLMRLVRRATQAERQAALSDRLRALGTLTAGIAHEIRNPLGILTLQVEELRAIARGSTDAKTNAEVQEIAKNLQGEITRLKALTEQFLEYARPPGLDEVHGTDLGAVLPPMLRLFGKGLSPDRRKVAEEFAEESFNVPISEARLGQVILNLLRNADEAMGESSGTISVALRREDDMAVIVVGDTGPGMTREVAAQVFDPFFTTRAEGTGLGLPLCRNIVETVGGRIDVETAPGEGARFLVRLPLVRDEG